MHLYQYCFCFLACLVLFVNSRFIGKLASNDESDEEHYHPYYYRLKSLYRPRSLERYLRNLVDFDFDRIDTYDESIPFERRTKAITKGDPREFMG